MLTVIFTYPLKKFIKTVLMKKALKDASGSINITLLHAGVYYQGCFGATFIHKIILVRHWLKNSLLLCVIIITCFFHLFY